MKRRVELSENSQLYTSAMLTLGSDLKILELVNTVAFVAELPTLKKFRDLLARHKEINLRFLSWSFREQKTQ